MNFPCASKGFIVPTYVCSSGASMARSLGFNADCGGRAKGLGFNSGSGANLSCGNRARSLGVSADRGGKAKGFGFNSGSRGRSLISDNGRWARGHNSNNGRGLNVNRCIRDNDLTCWFSSLGKGKLNTLRISVITAGFKCLSAFTAKESALIVFKTLLRFAVVCRPVFVLFPICDDMYNVTAVNIATAKMHTPTIV